MPFVNLELIRHMIDKIGEYDIVIPFSTKGKETLHAIYSINCLGTVKNQVELRNFRLLDILKFHKVEYICRDEIKGIDPDEYSFYNVNYPRDYDKALRIWEERK